MSELICAGQQRDPLVVAVAPCPPFVVEEGDKIGGLGVFLWDKIAQEIGVPYEIKKFKLNEALVAIGESREERNVDIGISCLSITSEREKYIDFSHSFYETYIGIAVRQRGPFEVVTQILTSPTTLKVVSIFMGLAALVGLIFFILEKGSNSKLYTMETGRGKFIEAFLVGTVFITRGPISFWEFKSLTARIIATVLAIGATFLIAGITALLASVFTIENLRSQISELGDLSNVRTGTLELSTSSRFLENNGIPHQTGPDIDNLMIALDRGKLDAVVFDEAYLRYAIKLGKEKGKFNSLSVLPLEFDEQNYGFAMPPDSPILEEVNQVLLEVRKRPEWRRRLSKYLGD